MCDGVGNMIKTAFTTVLYIFQQQHYKKTKWELQYWTRERLNGFASNR